MTRAEFDNLKTYLGVLSDRMKERDDDCAEPKNMVDKGYSLAVGHMNMEIERMLEDLEKQIFPKTEFSGGYIYNNAERDWDFVK